MVIVQNIKEKNGRILNANHLTKEQVEKVYEYVQTHAHTETHDYESIMFRPNGKQLLVSDITAENKQKSVLHLIIYNNLTKNKDRFTVVIEIKFPRIQCDNIANELKEFIK